MTIYFPAIIWLLSAVICGGIAKNRGIKPTAVNMLAALLGPVAVPLVLLAKPGKNNHG